jgi:hypothetical protein
LERQLLSLQASPYGVRGSDLASLAKKLGRQKVNRGKEPTYERGPLVQGMLAYPLTIPGHPGDLAVGTVKSIVNSLLSDVDEYRQLLESGSAAPIEGEDDLEQQE